MGIDIFVFNNKLDIVFDIFFREIKDMLMGVFYFFIFGMFGFDVNVVDLKIIGWELVVIWRERINKDWDYGIILVLFDFRVEIIKYDNLMGLFDEYYVGY